MSNRVLYERYHSRRRRQRRIISRRDFTYRDILTLIYNNQPGNKKILDIGCGVGTVDLLLAQVAKSVVGIDISTKAVKIAKENAANLSSNGNLKFKIMNFPGEIPTNKFDMVICSEILEHISDDKLAVLKIRKRLNLHGVVIATTPSLNAPLYKAGLLNEFDKKVGHLRRYSSDNFKKLFSENGFTVTGIYKREGILRNFMFTSKMGGFLLKIVNKWPFSEIFTFIDNLTIPIFGESDIQIVAIKK